MPISLGSKDENEFDIAKHVWQRKNDITAKIKANESQISPRDKWNPIQTKGP